MVKKNCFIAIAVVVILFFVAVSCTHKDHGQTEVFFSDPSEVVPTIDEKQSTPEGFSATIHIPGFAANPVRINGDTYYKMIMQGCGHTDEVGKPQIPFYVLYLAIPTMLTIGAHADPVIDVSAYDLTIIKDVVVYPVQRPVIDQEEFFVFEKDDIVYAQQNAYPDTLFETEIISVEGMSLFVVRLYPVYFHPSTHEVRFYKNIDVLVDFTPHGEDTAGITYMKEIDGEGKTIFSLLPNVTSILANSDIIEWHGNRYIPPPGTGAAQIYDDPLYHILIITDDDFLTQASELAAHKRDQLFWRVKLASTSDITPLSTDGIRDYIIAERQSNGRLAGGDVGDVDETTVDQAADFCTGALFKKRRDNKENIVLRPYFYSSPQVNIEIYFDTDSDPDPEYLLISLYPYSIFEVRSSSAPGYFDIVEYSGTPTVEDTAIQFEFSWGELFSVDTAKLWFVSKDPGPQDRMPDSGTILIDMNNYIPSLRYVILFGDVEHIPVEYSNILMPFGYGAELVRVGTDHCYSDLEGDIYTEIAVGRLSVDTEIEAHYIVEKIKRYESYNPCDYTTPQISVMGEFQDFINITSPLNGEVTWAGDRLTTGYNLESVLDDFPIEYSWQNRWIKLYYREESELKTTQWLKIIESIGINEVRVDVARDIPLEGEAIMAGIFDGRADPPFIDTAEKIRTYFLDQGISVERYYTVQVSEINPEFRTYPEKFSNGRALPDELHLPVYPWDADTNDVVDAFSTYDNLFILHRDHGSTEGWGRPEFHVSDVGSISSIPYSVDNMYPLVFSINCSSGHFDVETDGVFYEEIPENFAEALIRHQSGAIAVIAATRNSFSGMNDTFADGLIACMYPDYLYPSVHEGRRKIALGDMLNYAKIYTGPRLDTSTYDFESYYLKIYNCIGDPSLGIWRF
jgi:hypothetical protein